MAKKTRLDQVLLQRELADSLQHAVGLIMSGCVHSDSRRLDKPGEMIDPTLPLSVKETKSHPWVSRGGIKLAHALDSFHVDPAGMTAMDIGASTGGFTDVLLHHGAAKVFAVDVGYNELDWKLRNDPRVIVCEKTNARFLTAEQITEPIHILVCDASFIGLQTVLPTPLRFAANDARLIALIKPQFEVRKEQVGEKGIITDSDLHEEVCQRIETWMNSLSGWEVKGITPSPIKGMQGNTEFLMMAEYHP